MTKFNIFFLALMLLYTISCKNTTSNVKALGEEGEYFEGVLEYSIDYELVNLNYSKEKLKEHLGTKVIRSFSQGNWRDDFYNQNGTWVRTSIMNQTDKKYYYEVLGNDTVYYIDINKTDYKTTIKQNIDTIIENHNCWSLECISIKSTLQPDTVLSQFYISQSLSVNSSWYMNYINGGYDRIFNIAPGIIVTVKHTNAGYIQNRKLVSNKIEKIDKSKFEIESSRVIKRSPLYD